MKPSNEDLTKKYGGLIGDPFTVHGVQHCNHKPHPFMIGPRHVAYAADHCGGMLGKEVMEKIGCAMTDYKHGPRCDLPLSQHTSDHVLFLKLTRNCTNAEAAQALCAIKETMIADGLDGVAFIETGFRIAPPEPTTEGGSHGEAEVSD